MPISRIHRRAISLAAIPFLIIPIAFAACSSSGNSKATPTPTLTPVPTISTVTTSPTGSSTSGATASSDAAYVKQLCTAANDSINPVIDSIGRDPSILSSPQKMQDVLTPAITKLTDQLKTIKAPQDMQQYQDDLTQRFNNILDKAKAGKLTSIGDFSNAAEGVTPPPEDVQNRLRSAAQNEPECQQSLLFSTGLFGN